MIHNRSMGNNLIIRRAHGVVVASDGPLPALAIEIEAACPTFRRLMAVANAKGKFRFSFEPNRQSDIELTSSGCVLYALASGYRSETVDLANFFQESGENLGRIVLTRVPAADTNEQASAVDVHATGSSVLNSTTEAGISEPLSSNDLFTASNAALLENPSAYTCLESVMQARIDLQGRRDALQTFRADVAISDGKEIYGPADGQRFSNSAPRELLGYGFSTTGLFSSIAHALMAADEFAIQPAGELTSGGQTLVRYNFRSLPTTDGWKIVYGDESGTAAQQGWFLVDSKSQISQRIFVTAFEIPSNLQLTGLSALIDYERETIGGHRVLLPSVGKVEVGEQSGRKLKSFVSFDHCRAFTVSSAISFGETSARAKNSSVPDLTRLPAGVEILVSLDSAVSISSAEANDVITGTVIEAVIYDGQPLVEAGAVVEGHVRHRRGENAIVIQSDRVQARGGWYRFTPDCCRWAQCAKRL